MDNPNLMHASNINWSVRISWPDDTWSWIVFILLLFAFRRFEQLCFVQLNSNNWASHKFGSNDNYKQFTWKLRKQWAAPWQVNMIIVFSLSLKIHNLSDVLRYDPKITNMVSMWWTTQPITQIKKSILIAFQIQQCHFNWVFGMRKCWSYYYYHHLDT